MVLPRWLAHANRGFTNRLLGRLPARLSPFATLHHVGRRSGNTYSVPLAAFRTPDGFVLTPTYGPGADWVQNVLAAGTFVLDRRGRSWSLRNARLVGRHDAWSYLPAPVRIAMRMLRVRWFLIGDTV